MPSTRRSVLGGLAAVGAVGAGAVGAWAQVPGQPRSEPGTLASVRFQPEPDWIDLARRVHDGADAPMFRARLSGARGMLSCLMFSADGEVLGIGIGRDEGGRIARGLVAILDDRGVASDADPIETALWRGVADATTHASAWRQADIRTNAAVDAVAGLLAPPFSGGWIVSWSPMHPGLEHISPDVVLGSAEAPVVENAVGELIAADRLFSGLRSPALDRFAQDHAGRFRFRTQALDGAVAGEMLLLRVR